MNHLRYLDLLLEEKVKVFYRGGGVGMMPSGTAADVIKYEREVLGNSDIKVEPGVDPKKISTKYLVWVTEKKKDAKEYGNVGIVELEKYQIIARDGYGGLLINAIKEV